jgi:acyl-CoA thioesterase YciA
MELITTYICKKGDIGVHDNMFGGTIMSLIDDAAASYTAQICDTQRVVTLKIDELVFKKPVTIVIRVNANVTSDVSNSACKINVFAKKLN